jgi:hypothetical protein
MIRNIGKEQLNTAKRVTRSKKQAVFSKCPYAEFDASRDFFLTGGIDYILKLLDHDKAGLCLKKSAANWQARKTKRHQFNLPPYSNYGQLSRNRQEKSLPVIFMMLVLNL